MRRSRWCRAASKEFVAPGHCLFGADDTTRGFDGPLGIETQLGRKMGVRNRHYSWNAATSHIAENWKADDAAGTIPMISLGGQGYTETLVDEIGTGQHDAYWQSLFTNLGPIPGLFRPWMEMNGTHNAYQQNSRAYIDMWLRVWHIYNQSPAYGHLKWIFCPQQYDRLDSWPQYWPGSKFVDWMGLDLYRNVYSSCAPWYDWALNYKKPFCICESGFQQGIRLGSADKDGSLTGNSLITQTQADVKLYPNTVMYLVWNNVGPVGDDFIDTSPASLAQYQAFANDPYYL